MDNEENHSNVHLISNKRKNSREEEWASSTRFSNDEDEEENMLQLCLNSHRPSRPHPTVPPQPQTLNYVLSELHQLPNTQLHSNLLPIQQAHTQRLPSNHLQFSNTHPLYRGEPLLPDPLMYPFNGFYSSNGQPSSASAPSSPSPRPEPPLNFHQEVRPRAVNMPQPLVVPDVIFRQDVRPRAMQMPPPWPPTGGPRPLVIRSVRARRNPTQALGQGKPETVPAPFPWATTKRATVHNLKYLRGHNIVTISGDVKCKRCERQYKIDYNLDKKFMEVGNYIYENRSRMHDRAPNVWKDPVLPTCKYCEQENSARPVLAEKKKAINWLFLLLGQMLGCCTLEQLKYFCKHTRNHRTGAKDRVLYLTYLCLCKQLEPNGPFDV